MNSTLRTLTSDQIPESTPSMQPVNGILATCARRTEHEYNYLVPISFTVHSHNAPAQKSQFDHIGLVSPTPHHLAHDSSYKPQITVISDYFAADAPVNASISSILGLADNATLIGCRGDSLPATTSDKQKCMSCIDSSSSPIEFITCA